LNMYARHQAALAALTQSVLANADLPNLMRQAATLVAHTLAVGYSAIWELRPDSNALALRFGAGWPEDALNRSTILVEATCPIGSSVLGTSPTIVADWPGEIWLRQPALLRSHRVITSAYVMIPGAAGPFGSLGVDVTASRMFSDEEIHFLQAVANVLALAIERVQADQTLEQRIDERTREIEQRLVATAQERAVLEERQRLARDLHDSVTQALYGITLHAQAAWRLLAASEVANATDSLRALQDTAQEALDEMRLLIFELRPPVLEQVGLVAALQARLNAVEGRANLQTRLIVDEVGDLPSPVEQALYRIAQEALNNALRHAHAQHITVQLQQAQSQVMMEIVDDGIGFEPAEARENGGVGLRGIVERVAQLGGQVTVRSAAGAGARLRVEIAL
jgi:signal transduction histidine kinase